MTESPAAPRPHDHAPGQDHPPLPWYIKFWNLMAVLLPFLGLAVAVIGFWGTAFNWIQLSIMVVLYFVTSLGVTIGYHRLFTHGSFQTGPVMRAFLAFCGSLAVEGPVLWWVAMHRRHHQHADHDEDPHSPHLHGEGLLGLIKGLWHAHIGWLFCPQPKDLKRYVGDLQKDPVVRWMSFLFPLWVLASLAIPTVAAGLLTMSWRGAFLGLIWGGFVRIFFMHHVTWSINSVCHVWGSRPFDGDDESRNNVFFGVLAMGEGWHNNHHAFPTSARHGLWWWQFDASYWLIRGMEAVGLAWKVKVPKPEAIAAKRANPV